MDKAIDTFSGHVCDYDKHVVFVSHGDVIEIAPDKACGQETMSYVKSRHLWDGVGNHAVLECAGHAEFMVDFDVACSFGVSSADKITGGDGDDEQKRRMGNEDACSEGRIMAISGEFHGETDCNRRQSSYYSAASAVPDGASYYDDVVYFKQVDAASLKSGDNRTNEDDVSQKREWAQVTHRLLEEIIRELQRRERDANREHSLHERWRARETTGFPGQDKHNNNYRRTQQCDGDVSVFSLNGIVGFSAAGADGTFTSSEGSQLKCK